MINNLTNLTLFYHICITIICNVYIIYMYIYNVYLYLMYMKMNICTFFLPFVFIILHKNRIILIY